MSTFDFLLIIDSGEALFSSLKLRNENNISCLHQALSWILYFFDVHNFITYILPLKNYTTVLYSTNFSKLAFYFLEKNYTNGISFFF